MEASLYWIITIVFAIILSLILFHDTEKGKYAGLTEKKFRVMLCWVIFFCLQDTLWGLCSSRVIVNNNLFFISSTIFHISTVATTFFWLDYMLVFIGEDNKHRMLYLSVDGIVILFEAALVTMNFFKPTIFSIHDGYYIVERYRFITFINQFVVYLAIAFSSVIWIIQSKKEEKQRYSAAFMFALAPIIMGIAQLIYPEGPFYSMGYFLGCIVVHLFIVTSDREELQRGRILTSISHQYFSMHLINMEDYHADAFISQPLIDNLCPGMTNAQEMLNAVMKGTSCEDHMSAVMDFVNLETLNERMNGKNSVSIEFIGKQYGWTRISFIVVEENEKGISRVMFTSQIIEEEKKSLINLSYEAYNDALTGLFNRRSYENEIKELRGTTLPEKFAYVSMDINGLKRVNDTLGHDAGDELIIGAAECISRTLGKYGRVYRTGGDEFIALIRIEPDCAEQVMNTLQNATDNWRGERNESLAVSVGFVTAAEAGDVSINEISLMADKKMYEAKNNYYKQNGLDRRKR